MIKIAGFNLFLLRAQKQQTTQWRRGSRCKAVRADFLFEIFGLNV